MSSNKPIGPKFGNPPPFVYPATAGAGVNVFILDTGLNVKDKDVVADLLTKRVPEVKLGFSAIDQEGPFEDPDGHGSWMACVVGGLTRGVAKRANIIPVKVENKKQETSAGHLFIALNWIFEQASARGQPSIINSSGGTPTKFEPLDELYRALSDAGLYMVVAAGQSKSHPQGQDVANISPAGSGHAIVVGGTETFGDAKWPESNYGQAVNYWAPAENVGTMAKPNANGTSPAAALVSGVIALWIANMQGKSKAEVLAAMHDFAAKYPLTGGMLMPQAPPVQD